jgi:hypothetical protein
MLGMGALALKPDPLKRFAERLPMHPIRAVALFLILGAALILRALHP